MDAIVNLLVVTIFAISAAGQTNLAPNPGFESPDLAGYAVQARALADSDRPTEGKYSLRHEAAAGHLWNCVQMINSVSVPVQPGFIYTLSTAARSSLTSGQAFFGLREIDASGNTVCFRWQSIPINSSDWQTHVLDRIRPTAQSASMQIYFRISPEASDGAVWWDDVKLQAQPDPFAGKPPALLRFAPLETLVLTRQEDQAVIPAGLPLLADFGPDTMGGTLQVRLSPVTTHGQTHAEPLWVTSHTPIAPAIQDISMPTAGLREGRYEYRISFKSMDQQTQLEISKPLAVIRPQHLPPLPPIERSEVGTDGFLLVNGQPLLSIYYFHNPLDPAGLKMLREEYGATTVQVWGDDSVDTLCERVETAWQAGLYSWAVLFHPAMFDEQAKRWKTAQLTEAVNRLKNHPGLLGWDLFDEPDGLGVAPDEVRRAFDIVRQLDPNHLIWVNLCVEAKFTQFAGLSDLASYDHYPIPARSLSVIRDHNRSIRAAFSGKPLLSCLQAYAPPGLGMPTPDQLRAMVYLNVCEGMTLFHYYSWSDPEPSGSLANSPELRSYTRLLNHELHSLRPFLFSTKIIPVTIQGEEAKKLFCLAKQIEQDVELIVVNPEPTPVTRFSASLAERRITSAKPLFDTSRKVWVDQGALTDALPAYGVGVYRLQVSEDRP